jgi:hypothetical protein
MTDSSNPGGIGLGGPSGAPVVNQAPSRPDQPTAPAGTAPTHQTPIDPGDQTAQPPDTGLRVQQLPPQQTAPQAVQGSRNDVSQMDTSSPPDDGNADQSRNMGAAPDQQAQAHTLTSADPRAQNLPDQEAAGQVQSSTPVQGEPPWNPNLSDDAKTADGSDTASVQPAQPEQPAQTIQPEPPAQPVQITQPEQSAQPAQPNANGDTVAPLMRMLALKLLVDNGGQIPNLDGLESPVQQVLDHVQRHAGRMGLLGSGTRPDDPVQKTLATLLAYGLVATVGTQPNLDVYQQGVQQLVAWAHKVGH